MLHLDDFHKLYDIGKPIFDELFKLNTEQLKQKLTSICNDSIPDKGLIKEGTVRKTTKNDEPEEITIYHYNSLSINWIGISYRPEHGNEKLVVKFNEHFKL